MSIKEKLETIGDWFDIFIVFHPIIAAFIFFTILSILITVCVKTINVNKINNPKIVTIDNCEYIVSLNGGAYTHKFNCSNLIHKSN